MRKSNTTCSLSYADPSFYFLYMSIDVNVNVAVAHETRKGTMKAKKKKRIGGDGRV